jgi:hypothetical protein
MQQVLLKLEKRIKRSGSVPTIVKFRKVNTARPFECLEMNTDRLDSKGW